MLKIIQDNAAASPNILQEDVLIIDGGAAGADRIACDIANSMGASVGWWHVSCPAQWTKGKKAGPLRNQQMLDEFHPDLVLAFPIGESKGTRDMIRRAEKAGIECKIFESKERA